MRRGQQIEGVTTNKTPVWQAHGAILGKGYRHEALCGPLVHKILPVEVTLDANGVDIEQSGQMKRKIQIPPCSAGRRVAFLGLDADRAITLDTWTNE